MPPSSDRLSLAVALGHEVIFIKTGRVIPDKILFEPPIVMEVPTGQLLVGETKSLLFIKAL